MGLGEEERGSAAVITSKFKVDDTTSRAFTATMLEHADCIITPTVTWDYLDKLRDAEDKRQEESPNCTASVVSWWCQCYY